MSHNREGTMKIFRKRRGFTLIELMIVVAIIGILAAIAIPNFIKFQAKSKQSEAKANLKGLFTAEKSYYGEHDGYSNDFNVVGFAPEGGNRYAYSLLAMPAVTPVASPAATVAALTPANAWPPDTTKVPASAPPSGMGTAPVTTAIGGATISAPGVGGTCPACVFQGAAYGNIDTDPSFDTWAIGSDLSTGAAVSTCNPSPTAAGGVPMNIYDDVSC
jgi:type IV pilus assembly protein PilA